MSTSERVNATMSVESRVAVTSPDPGFELGARVGARVAVLHARDLSEDLVAAFRRHEVPHEVAILRCGHYSTGKAPFKFVDGWILTRFLKRALMETDSQGVA